MQYRRSIVTFLDILGFSKFVENSERPAAEIGSLLETLDNEAKPSPWAAKALDISFLSFSDCTVRAVPIKRDADEAFPFPARMGILACEMMNLAMTQIDLLSDGFFLRGALTIGNICIEGSRVFGPALVRAHSLESEFAVYPRIVIDPGVFDALKTDELLRHKDSDLETERTCIRKLVHCDSDGLFFVDYLRAFLPELDKLNKEFDYLKKHKQMILIQSDANKSLSKIAAKYLWVATYHNSVIRDIGEKQFSKRGLDINSFLIGNDALSLLVDF